MEPQEFLTDTLLAIFNEVNAVQKAKLPDGAVAGRRNQTPVTWRSHQLRSSDNTRTVVQRTRERRANRFGKSGAIHS